jgi:choice-of-anchor B domain-containing protein
MPRRPTGRRGGGYTHDAQCTIYRGPDKRYRGREICLAANERQLSIADVTDKENPVALSIGEYPNPGYLHQGWLTEDHRYFFMDDETDLLAGSVVTTRTLVFDVSDLEDPILHREFMGSFPASAHNLYIDGDLMYQANYRHGLHVIDISDPSNPVEVGHLDTAPHLSGPGFSGAWGSYPFFESGAVGVTSVHEGLFLVRYRDIQVVFDEEN